MLKREGLLEALECAEEVLGNGKRAVGVQKTAVVGCG